MLGLLEMINRHDFLMFVLIFVCALFKGNFLWFENNIWTMGKCRSIVAYIIFLKSPLCFAWRLVQTNKILIFSAVNAFNILKPHSYKLEFPHYEIRLTLFFFFCFLARASQENVWWIFNHCQHTGTCWQQNYWNNKLKIFAKKKNMV